MSLVRRFVLLAALTLSGGIGLAACQSPSAPGLAAQVGDVRLMDAQVEEIVSQIDDRLIAQDQARIDREQSATPQPSGSPAPTAQGLPADVFGNVRQSIVEWTVFNELARVYVQEKGLSWTRPDYERASQQVGLEPQRQADGTTQYNRYVVLYADTVAYRQLLVQTAQRAVPTEADLQEAYRRALAAGAIDQTVTFEQVRPQLLQFDEVRAGVWLRNELKALADRIGVAVSPRYQPLEVATGILVNQQSGQQLVVIALPLGETSGSPAVRDAG